MTARQLQLACRDVAIWAARKGGALVPMIALAHGLSVRRVQAILKRMARPEVQSATLRDILDALENQASAASRGRKRGAPRAAYL